MNQELHILILEDRQVDAELVERELQREKIPFTAKRVWTEPAFLEELRNPALDIILADYSLPGFDGLTALKHALQERPEVPFIFVSGSLGEETAIDALHRGATDYVLKTKLERLVPAVRRALREIEERNRTKAAEDELRMSEARYRKLFQDATEGIVLADANTGEILDCNRAFLEMSEYDRSDLLGRPQKMLHPAEQGNEPVSSTFALHRTQKEGTILPTELVTKSGAVKQVEIKANNLEVGGRKILQGFFRDISVELRYHRERETSLKLLRLLNTQTDTQELIRSLITFLQQWTGCDAVGVRLKDGEDYPYFETRGLPQEFVRMENSLCARDEGGQLVRDIQGNPILECMCGNVLCGRFNPALPFFTPKGSFWTNSTTELLATTTEAERQSQTRNRCNGEGYESVALFALRHGSQTLGLLQFNHRAKGRFSPELITFLENAADQIAIALAQRQSQDALRISEQRFAIFMEHLPAVVFIKDLQNRFVFVNEFFQELYGKQDWVGKDAAFLIPPQVARAMEEHDRKVLAEGPAVIEERVLDQHGVERVFETHKFPIKTNDVPVWIGGIAVDVTEKKKLEAQFLRAQRLESIGSLASGIAHDINNILSPIMMTMTLLREEVSSPEGESLLNSVEDCANRGAAIVRQLLTFGRGALATRQTVNPERFLNEIAKIVEETFPKNIQAKVTYPNSLWSINGDPTQLHQALLNLCVNARDAMPTGGWLHLKAVNILLDKAFAQMCPEAKEGPHVVLSVADTGSGIPLEILDKIFDPFFTTKEPGKGTGLGLATVQKIAQNHGGFVQVLTELGKGTEFRLFLPAAPEDAPPDKPKEDQLLLRGGNGELVLVVDDELSVRSSIGTLLEKHGYRVLLAKDGTDAIGQFALHRLEVALVLTDFMMPILDGVSTIRALRNMEPNLKVVLMTGWADPGKQASMAGLNPLVLLHKPFTGAVLLRILSEALQPTQRHSA